VRRHLFGDNWQPGDGIGNRGVDLFKMRLRLFQHRAHEGARNFG
jgi:hypothetical protein